MRPSFLIFVLALVLLIATLLFWRRPVHPPTQTEQPRPTSQSTYTPATTNTVSKNAPSAPTANQPNTVTRNKAERLEIARDEIERANVPVHIYGLVIDQDSNALPGVDIKSGIRHWTMPDPNFEIAGSDQIPLETTTGANGRFELSGATGDVLGVVLTKAGYEAEHGSYGFGPASGSYENPIVFKMWNTNIHEKLITNKKSFHIAPDGRPYFINLADGTINESGTGDLKVWIQYTNQVRDNGLYEWSAGIDVINGGLEATSDYPMWMAPAQGYSPNFYLRQKIKGYQGGELGRREFYILLNHGHYGQMTINLYAPYNLGVPGLVSLSYAINPSGSRILR